jgi:hypothetical protein
VGGGGVGNGGGGAQAPWMLLSPQVPKNRTSKKNLQVFFSENKVRKKVAFLVNIIFYGPPSPPPARPHPWKNKNTSS